MKNILIFATLFILLSLAVSKGCSLKEKSLNKKIKQYQKKCLKKGFQSSLGCKSKAKKLKKKSQKKCEKLERLLKKCDYSCSPQLSSPTNGGWTEFGDWTECSAACGGGTQTSSRTCTNPSSANGGAECQGRSTRERECNTQRCPGMILLQYWSFIPSTELCFFASMPFVLAFESQ